MTHVTGSCSVAQADLEIEILCLTSEQHACVTAPGFYDSPQIYALAHQKHYTINLGQTCTHHHFKNVILGFLLL